MLQSNETYQLTLLFIYYYIEDNTVHKWKENKGKYAVYRLINCVTGTYYVESSMIINRIITCYLNANYVKIYKHNSIIYSAILKHRLSALSFEILEYCYK